MRVRSYNLANLSKVYDGEQYNVSQFRTDNTRARQEEFVLVEQVNANKELDTEIFNNGPLFAVSYNKYFEIHYANFCLDLSGSYLYQVQCPTCKFLKHIINRLHTRLAKSKFTCQYFSGVH